MHALAQSTLDQVREIIDVVDGDAAIDAAENEEIRGSLHDALRRVIDGNERYLSSMHMQGKTDLAGGRNMPVERISADTLREIKDFLDHMYMNILIHGIGGTGEEDAYYASVTVEGDRISIVQCNETDDRHIQSHPGKGLTLHRQRIALLGGTLVTSLDDRLWTLRAVIPLHEPA